MSNENGLTPLADAAIRAQEAIHNPQAVAAGQADLERAFHDTLSEFRATAEFQRLANVRAGLATYTEALSSAKAKAVALEASVEKKILAGGDAERLEADLSAALEKVDGLQGLLEKAKRLEAAERVAVKSAWEDRMLKLALDVGQAARAELEAAAPEYVNKVTALTGPISRAVVRFHHARGLRDRALPRE